MANRIFNVLREFPKLKLSAIQREGKMLPVSWFPGSSRVFNPVSGNPVLISGLSAKLDIAHFISKYTTLLLLLLLLFSSALVKAADRYSVASGNWNSTGTWSATSGGSSGASVPVAGDNVYIEGNRTVTINVNANCANISIASGSILNIGAFTTNFSGITTLSGTLNVSSNTGSKTFNQIIIAGGTWNNTATETFAINGMTLSGATIGGTVTGIFNIAAGGLIISPSTTNTLNNSTFSVTGPTQVNGTLAFGSATGTKTFIGLVTNNGVWNNTANSAITFRGGITNNGTFSSGTGTYTFITSNQSVGGTSPISFNGTVTITGTITITNLTEVTIAGNLTGSVAGSTWLNAANSRLNAGNTVLTTGTLTATASGNTVNYYRAGTQTVKPATYLNLTLSGTSAKTTTGILVNGVLSMEGSATASVAPGYGVNATLQYNTSISRVSGVEWVSTFTGTGGIIISSTGIISLNAAKIVNGPFSINNGASFSVSASNFALTIGGNFSNSGSFTAGSGTVTFNGSVAQIIQGSSLTTFNNLTLNNSTGLILSAAQNTSINGTLTFTNGKITTGFNVLIIGIIGSVSGAGSSNYVAGNMQKVIAAATASFTFTVGDASSYAPVTLSFSGTTNAGGNITASANSGDHPEIASSTIDPSFSVNRFWSLSNSGVSGFTTYSATYNFPVSDIDAGADYNSFVVGNYTTGWTYPTIGIRSATSTQAVGMNSFGDFQIGQCIIPAQPSVISGNTAVCSGSTGLTYSVIDSPGVIYNWVVPSDWTITSGQSTNSITVTTGTVSGIISVTPANYCGSGTSRSLTVSVSQLPTVSADASPTEICSGQMITLTASAIPLTPLPVLLSENFDETTNNWVKINNTSGGIPENSAWTLRPDGYIVSSITFNSNDNSQFYMSNSDASETGSTTATILQSPGMSTIGYSSLSLSFWHHYRYYDGNESGKVEVSVNGTDWTEIAIYISEQGTAGAFVNVNLNLDTYINQSSFYVRFKYDATYDWWWVIDNVSITGTPINYDYLYSWVGTPSETAGLPTGAGTPASENISVEAAPTATTTYTAYAQNTAGCIGSAVASVTVNPLLPVSVSIIASENPVCTGTTVTFTATPVNGGANPFYQWKVNGINVGINSPIYSSSALANNDQLSCEMTSEIICVSGSPATSNTITMTVNPVLPASVSIAASANPICAGTSVVFTATPTNGGTSPSYQWKLDGSDVGSNSATYINASIINGNIVTCVMTSDLGCVSGNPAISNTIVMEVGQPIGNNSLDLSSGNFGTTCGTAVENANATVSAPAGTYIAHILFASYGTPNGSCGTFTYGACDATTSFQVTENYLLGNNSSVIPATNGVFGDPCVGTVKRLYIQAIYAEPFCVGRSPGEIMGTLPTGGNGTFTYLWESSTTSATTGFSAADGINDQQNYTPGNLSQTTWFKRTAYSAGCSNTSRVIQITISVINTWTGSFDSDWNNSANWSCFIPDLTTDITFSSGLTNYPVLNSGPHGQIRNIIIEPGASVIVSGNTLEIAGTINSSGSFTASNGSIEMRGSLTQDIAANLFTANSLKDLTINNSQGVNLGGTLYLTGILKAQTGNLATNNHLTLSSSPTQTALIDGAGNGEVLGDVILQRYLPSGFGYKYFASPFQAATVAEFGDDMDLTAAFPAFYSYIENKESTGWNTYNDPTGILSPLNGYCANFGTNSAPTTADIAGVVNNGTIGPLALYNNDKTYTEGFNLLGNPYPSPIDWNAPVGWTKTNIDDAIYFFNAGTTDQYTGTYSSYVNGISSDGIAGNIIPSMQGFFVHVSDGAYPVSGSISIGNQARVNQLSPVFHKSHQTRVEPMVRLSAEFLNENNMADALVVYLDHLASANFEKESDALKLHNTATEVPSLFAISADNRQLSIGAFPYPDTEGEIALGIKTEKAGTLNLKLISSENIPSAYSIYLKDKASGRIQNLIFQPDYSFSVDQGILEGRLSIVFSETDISQEVFGSNSFSAFSGDGVIYVNIQLKEEQVNVQVYNLAGQAILNKAVNGEGRHIIGTAPVAGIYMITFFTDMGTISKKIFVQ